jgi:hypothetical protein
MEGLPALVKLVGTTPARVWVLPHAACHSVQCSTVQYSSVCPVHTYMYVLRYHSRVGAVVWFTSEPATSTTFAHVLAKIVSSH